MRTITIILLLLVYFVHPIAGQVKLPRLIRDSMILQRDVPVKIWGWAAPNEKIKVALNKQRFSAVADQQGNWSLLLPATKAGGPYTIQIDASNHISIREILFGDVWLCSGQSNMVHQMELHKVLYAAEIAAADYAQIRQFWVPTIANMQAAQADLPTGYWKSANAANIGAFSAVAYFFAKNVYDKYRVPIGLINASWGGTPIEAWMSENGFKDFTDVQGTIQKNKDTAYINGLNKKPTMDERSLSPPEDKGMVEKWFSSTYQPKAWRTISIPGYWEDQGIRDLDGVVWYRREIDVPAGMINNPAKVFLGRIVDADVLYINGQQVGTTGYMYPQRRYPLPAGLLQPGKNLFVIRVTNNAGKGGFVPGKPYQLIAGTDTVDLTGYWQYKVGRVNTPQRAAGGGSIAVQNQPTALYNSMIAPLVNYAVKGFLWYQGESNTARADSYTRLQNAMIADWRQKWTAPAAPFIYVQLPGFMDMNYMPAESQWAMFREAQLKSLAIANTAMAVAIDLGEWNDIHPDRKKEVGERLALAARHMVYREQQLVYSGPLFQSVSIAGKEITISFTHTGGGLIANDSGALSEFAIAGADKKFVWAHATINGDKVVVWNDIISAPMYVRYAWADFPVNPNLYNKEGLPASPFRTDQ